MNLGMGTPKEHGYSHVPTLKPSLISHQHSPSSEEGNLEFAQT